METVAVSSEAAPVISHFTHTVRTSFVVTLGLWRIQRGRLPWRGARRRRRTR